MVYTKFYMILQLTEEDGIADEIDQAYSFKETVYTALSRSEHHSDTGATACVALEPPKSASPPRGSRVKLSKLSIWGFDGDVTKWTSFWGSYKSAIHNNPELMDIDKFNYLRSLVECTAHEAISGLTLTAANYQQAITTLKKRFGNKQQITARHVDIHSESRNPVWN